MRWIALPAVALLTAWWLFAHESDAKRAGSGSAGWVLGEYGDTTPVYKFGFNNDIDNVEESIWDGDDASGAGNGPARCPADTTAFTLYASSDDAGDTQDVTVEGIGADWAALSATVTLTGQTRVKVGVDSAWGSTCPTRRVLSWSSPPSRPGQAQARTSPGRSG